VAAATPPAWPAPTITTPGPLMTGSDAEE